MSNFKTQVIRNLKPYSKYFGELNKPALRNIIQVCVHFIEARNLSSEIYDKAKIKLTSSGDFPEHYDELFSAVFQLFQAFLRIQKGMIKEEDLKSVLKELKFPDECQKDLAKVLFTHRDSLSQNLHEMKALQTPTKSICFRINISLCDSGISKLNQPTILLSMIINNEFRTLEIPLAIFHRLRYKVALLLKEMQTLEDRQIMKK